MTQVYINTLGWIAKSYSINKAIPNIVEQAVTYGIDILHSAVLKNVSGPAYGTVNGRPIRGFLTNAGKLPVPVVTGALRRSILKERIQPNLGVVYSSNALAKYNRYVHYGTRKMAPRRFVEDAARERKQAIENHFRYLFLMNLRKLGFNR